MPPTGDDDCTRLSDTSLLLAVPEVKVAIEPPILDSTLHSIIPCANALALPHRGVGADDGHDLDVAPQRKVGDSDLAAAKEWASALVNELLHGWPLIGLHLLDCRSHGLGFNSRREANLRVDESVGDVF